MPRPDSLNPLFRSVRSVKGIGPQIAALISKLCAPEGEDAILLDVLTHMPVSVVDRRAQTGVALALPGMIVTLKLTIDKHQAPPPGTHRMPYRVFARDPTGEIQLTWFVSKAPWLEASLPPGAERYVSGLVTSYQGQ
ncbi:MAG: ATP-dependent DNA helicase RecG, partial [Cucumibacter sp.]